MKANKRLIDRIAPRFFGALGRDRRAPHPLFLDLYERVRTALEDAELCLHQDLTSRPNSVDIFFNFDTWGQFVASRRAQVQQALETEIEAHRRDAGYRDDERIALRLFVADPAQLDVPPNRPEVVARRVPDPHALDELWTASLKHTTVIGGRAGESRSFAASTFSSTRQERAPDTVRDRDPSGRSLATAPNMPSSGTGPSGIVPSWIGPSGTGTSGTVPVTRPTPLACLTFMERKRRRVAVLEGPGVFGRGSACDITVELDPKDRERALEVVSRRALSFRANRWSGVLEVENLGRWPLEARIGSAPVMERLFSPGALLPIERSAELFWPGDGGERFLLRVDAPRRGTVALSSARGEQRIVLRAPRTWVSADPEVFGEVGVQFNVDFVDGTRFLILNNEGVVPLRLGALEGKQLQWPIDAPREIEAAPITIAIELDPESESESELESEFASEFESEPEIEEAP